MLNFFNWILPSSWNIICMDSVKSIPSKSPHQMVLELMVVIATRHGNEVEFDENIDLIYDDYLEKDDGDLYLDLETSLFFLTMGV